MKTITLLACLLMAGCVSTSAVTEIGRDTYTVSATSDGLRSASAARQSALETGTARCASMGKHFMFLKESVEKTRLSIDTTISVSFRCLLESDPDYRRPQ